MQIGKIIRKYRKEKGITQEEMAKRLGVTAPAVNKWENSNSTPDITLLAPIARLLHISLDELLSYREDITEEEIRQFVLEIDEKLKVCPYEEVFAWGKSLLEEYPDCGMLIWQIALILDSNRLFREVDHSEQYDEQIVAWYKRALESSEEMVRHNVAGSLYAFYMRKNNFDEAEKCLEHFSVQNPERKRMRANIAWKQGRKEEAYKAQEELIFSEFEMLQMSLHNLYIMALEDKDFEKASYIVEKQREIGKASDFGTYHENTYGLELLIEAKDVDGTIEWMEKVLNNVDHMWGFTKSRLFEHMEFKKVENQFVTDLVKNLKESFADKETYGYLIGDERWENLIK